MYSMTGFGRAECLAGNSQFVVEIKSVNHRYLETRFRLPPSLSQYEGKFLEQLRTHFERGSFEISIKQKPNPKAASLASTKFAVDTLAMKSLIEGAQELKSKFQVTGDIDLNFLASTGRVFIALEEPEDEENLTTQVNKALQAAIKELDSMRENEGRRLKEILKGELSGLNTAIAKLVKLAPDQPKKIEQRLKAKIAQWTLPSGVDAQRLEMEILFHAERADVTEELARLKTHTAAFLELLDAKGSVGRRLDFLTQELHREINTLSSKVAAIEMTQVAVEMKSAVEKLREQVQNVE